MTKAEYLRRYEMRLVALERLIETYNQMSNVEYSSPANINGTWVSGTGSHVTQGQSKIEKSVIRKMMLEQKIQKETAAVMELADRISNAIDKLEDPLQRLVLFQKYMNFKGIGEIAWDLNRSEDRIYIIHSQALKNLDLEGAGYVN